MPDLPARPTLRSIAQTALHIIALRSRNLPMVDAEFEAALSLHRAGKLVEAEVAYRACLRIGESKANGALATLLLQQGRYGEAAQSLEPLAAAAPDDAGLAVNLSIALRHVGRLDDACRAAQRACALAPAQVASWNALGLAFFERGHHDDALAAFESGLNLAPGHAALDMHRAHCLHRLARSKEALAIYQRVTASSPQLLDAWRGLATVQSLLGLAHEAVRSRQQARALAPQDRDVTLEYAAAMLLAGQVEEAARLFAAAVEDESDDAQAWCWLGRARLREEDLDAARVAFARAQLLDPHDPVIAHYHAASGGTLLEAVESDYIRRLFDDFAGRFDQTLVGRLSYATPALIARFLGEHAANGGDRVLDLGCGTGLMAQALARHDRRTIDGVDLSPRMVDEARAKGLYRELHVAELIEFLDHTAGTWDLILAADVFVYLAELRPVFAAVFARLAPGGYFAFSVEISAGQRVDILPNTGRYRHSPKHLQRELVQAGFVDVVHASVALRQEMGKPVAGELILARVL